MASVDECKRHQNGSVQSPSIEIPSDSVTRCPTEDNAKARRRLAGIFAVCGSMLTLVLGLITVVFFLRYKIVPLYTTMAFEETKCRVVAIDGQLSNTTGSLHEAARHHVNIENYNTTAAAPTNKEVTPGNCTRVTVEFQRYDGIPSLGVLMDSPLKQEASHETKCRFGELPTSLLLSQIFPSLGNGHKMSVGQTYRCFIDERGARDGDTAERQSMKNILLKRSENFRMKILYILPPTVIFTVGFVGLFFSCVYYQRNI